MDLIDNKCNFFFSNVCSVVLSSRLTMSLMYILLLFALDGIIFQNFASYGKHLLAYIFVFPRISPPIDKLGTGSLFKKRQVLGVSVSIMRRLIVFERLPKFVIKGNLFLSQPLPFFFVDIVFGARWTFSSNPIIFIRTNHFGRFFNFRVRRQNR